VNKINEMLKISLNILIKQTLSTKLKIKYKGILKKNENIEKRKIT
jgi:hypothetical protein